MLVLLTLLLPYGEARLANLANPVNHVYEFTNEEVDSSEYKFVIFADPQFGKQDRDHR